MGEVLNQVWLKSITNKCTKTEYLLGSCKLPQAHKKDCDENEGRKKTSKKMTHIWKEVVYKLHEMNW